VLTHSTPGVTGLALVLLLCLLGWSGRAQARSQRFDRFWYIHNLVLVAWPLTMFAHGSNQWIGVGFPLVAFTASVPICLYAVDRAARLLRYYLFGGRAVRITDAVIRPGKGGGKSGALTQLTIRKPPGLWSFAPGMYAFICMPEYAPMQWHPFTICSGKSDEHVEFIIAGVGDWTQELAEKCLRAQDGGSRLPTVALDGPYAAPAQSALSRSVLVAVGAGVGITPFLSLMSSLISLLEDDAAAAALPLKEAHFFWMTRSVDEFLFGRRHFSRIAASKRLRQKVHLHLHTTARETDGSAAAYLFRQAVRRQSRVDRAAFGGEFDAQRVLTAPQLPWCWVNKSELDVVWLSDLTTAGCGAEGEESQAPPAEPPHDDGEMLDAAEQGVSSTTWALELLRRGSRRRTTRSVNLAPSRTFDEGGSQGPEGDSEQEQLEPLVPVAFGRPDFELELRAIGKHWHCQERVHVYVCGNDAIVKGLRSTADTLNAEARADAGKSLAAAQKYVVTYERFG